MIDFIDDKRLFDRFLTRFPVRFKNMGSGFSTNGRLNNFSAGGVKITTNKQLYINDSVNLKIDLPDGKESKTIRGEVIWVTRKSAKVLEAGLKFCKIVFMDEWRIYKFVEHRTYITTPV